VSLVWNSGGAEQLRRVVASCVLTANQARDELKTNLQAAARSIVCSGAAPAGGRLDGRAISTIAKREFGVRFVMSREIGPVPIGGGALGHHRIRKSKPSTKPATGRLEDASPEPSSQRRSRNEIADGSA
jgi:hypothetical protein